MENKNLNTSEQLEARGIIAGFRKAKGYNSHREMAKLLNVSPVTYLKWEKNPSKIPCGELARFEELLGEEFIEFFFEHKLYKQ